MWTASSNERLIHQNIHREYTMLLREVRKILKTYTYDPQTSDIGSRNYNPQGLTAYDEFLRPVLREGDMRKRLRHIRMTAP